MTDEALILDPGNPFDFGDGSLDGLAGDLRREMADVEVRVHLREEEGYGGPLVEVLAIWETAATFLEHAITMAVVGRFLQKRWKDEQEKCGPDEKPRPRAATGYDRSGEPRWSIRVDLPDGTVVRIDDQFRAERPAPSNGDEP